MDVSIVIPVYRAQETLETCLASIAAQDGKMLSEIIIVDSSERPFRADERPGIKVIQLGEKTLPGIARNIGAKHATGRTLLFVDSDVELPPNAVERLYSESNKAVVSAPALIFSLRKKMISRKLEYFIEFNQCWPGSAGPKGQWLPSYCLAIDRALFCSTQGFLNYPAFEDVLLTKELSKMGAKLSFLADTVAVHHSNPRIDTLVKKFFLFGKYAMVIRFGDVPFIRYGATAIVPLLGLIKLFNIVRYNLLNAPIAWKLEFLVFLPAILTLMPFWALGALQGLLCRARD